MERERSESHGVRIYTGSLFLLLSESSGAVLLIFTAKAKHSDWKKMVGGQGVFLCFCYHLYTTVLATLINKF